MPDPIATVPTTPPAPPPTAPPSPAQPPAPSSPPPTQTPSATDDEPKKIELTEAELQARIDAAKDEDRRKIADKAAKDKEIADRKAAEEQGKWQEIADKEKARAEAAEQKIRRRELQDSIHAAMKKDHPGYEENAVDVLPHVLSKLEADDKADAARVVSAECRAFVERTGPKAKPGGAAPTPPGGFGDRMPAGSLAGTAVDPAAGNNNDRKPMSAIARGF